MNKQLFIGLTAVAAMLTACSQDEVLEVNMDSNVIRIGANAGVSSRAFDSYCPHVMPSTFKLTAVHNGSEVNTGIYFKDDAMVQSIGNEYAFANSDRYWPDNALDFYAWHCTSGANFSLQKVNPTTDKDSLLAVFTDFTVADAVEAQEDLLYGSTFGAVKSKSATNIVLNHALSQVTFKAKVENENIRVAIKEVGLVNLLNKGTFIWPDTIAGYDKATYQAYIEVLYQQMKDEAENGDKNGDENQNTGSQAGGNNPSQIGYGAMIANTPAIRGGWLVETDSDGNSSLYDDSQVSGGNNPSSTTSVFNVYNTHAAGKASYNVVLPNPVKLVANAVEGDGSWETGTQVLTAAPADHTAENGWNNVMQLMPQYSLGAALNSDTMLEELVNMKRGAPKHRMIRSLYASLDFWKARKLTSCSLPMNTEDVFIRLACDITTISEESGKEILLYASEKDGKTQYLYIPVSIFWEPGYRYVYTINFAKHGNGGVTDPEDPEAVLNTIRISADVAEYTETNVNASDEFGISESRIITVSDSMLEELLNLKR